MSGHAPRRRTYGDWIVEPWDAGRGLWQIRNCRTGWTTLYWGEGAAIFRARAWAKADQEEQALNRQAERQQ
jgi:hypothetical protein